MSQLCVSPSCCCIRQWALESVWMHLFRLSLSAQGWIEKLFQLCWWVSWWQCVCVLGVCTDFASPVSGHKGHMTHASSNLHCGRRMRNSLITNNSQILFLLTVLIMEKQSAFFHSGHLNDLIECYWSQIASSSPVPAHETLGAWLSFWFSVQFFWLWNTGMGKLNLACPQGLYRLRIPTQIAANTPRKHFL